MSVSLKNFFAKIPKIITVVFSVYIAGTLLLNVILNNSFNQYFKPNLLSISSILPFGTAALLFAAVTLICSFAGKRKGASERGFYLILALIFLFVFIIQLFISYNFYFYTGWVAGIVTGTAYNMAARKVFEFPASYYEIYPNNLFITYFLVVLYRIGFKVIPSHPYALVLVTNNLAVCAGIFLAVICIYKITNKKAVTLAAAFMGILIGAFSPWIVIPYTDTYSMLFAALAIFSALFLKGVYKYLFFSFSCFIGYLFKPTVLIIFIAAVILGIVNLLSGQKIEYKKAAAMLCCVAIAAASAFSVKHILVTRKKLPAEKSMTITHYLMMGLNSETEGVYSSDDVKYSRNIGDKKARQEANIKIIRERLEKMGFNGFAKLVIKKNLSNYNDGTFAWSREGGFYRTVYPSNLRVTMALRDFYCNKPETFRFLAQTIWFFILLCICFSAFLKVSAYSGIISLVALSLFGESIFLLLFECRARYLFLYLPLFLILAAVGLAASTDFCKKIIFERKIENGRN